MAGLFVMQKGRLLRVNDALAELFGYSSAQALLGKSLWELIHPDDHKQVRIGRKQDISGSRRVRAMRKDGTHFRVDIQGDIVLLEGRPVFVGCMIGDSVMESQEGCPQGKKTVDGFQPAAISGSLQDLTVMRHLEREMRQRHAFMGIVGKSKRMQDIYRLLEDLADLDHAVLITGESGTGKMLIAKALHLGGRALASFGVMDCSLSDESLLENQMHAHIQGVADGGTLLLDEIGDASPLAQLRLLKLLAQKERERAGDAVLPTMNARFIACTRHDLRPKVKAGEFREDLYFRLRQAEICLPPLRERREDIPLLAEHLRKRYNHQFRKGVKGIDGAALAALMDYDWPGNVRELEHVLERALVACDANWVAMEHLPVEIQQHAGPDLIRVPLNDTQEDSTGPHEILKALNKTFWNKSKAARLIGISRQTLYRKMHEYGLNQHSAGNGCSTPGR